MAKLDRPRSPFAGKIDFSAQAPLRAMSADEIGQMLAAHRLYVETERRRGRRADFGSVDLSGLDFSGLNLRRIKMDGAVLKGANLVRTGLRKANLVGTILQQARLDGADLSGARLSGANLVSASL